MKKIIKKNDTSPKTDGIKTSHSFFEKYSAYFLYISLLLTLVNSILLFDIRVSLSGDDSAYIIRAFDLISGFKFPGYQGPLYPIILSPFVFFFGIQITLLKSISIVFMLGFILFFYKTFKSRLPSLVLVFSLFALSLNPYLLYYSSQTYSEALFMFVQIIFFFFFFTTFIDTKENNSTKRNIKRHLILGLLAFLLGLTRNIGFISVFCIVLYFMLHKQWKSILYFIFSFLIIYMVYMALIHFIFKQHAIPFSTQASGLLNKDYYSPLSGHESFHGFIIRLTENSKNYLAIHVSSFFGITVINTTVISFITVFVYLILAFVLFFSFKRNPYIFFTAIYITCFIVATFIMLQTIWNQSRLIIPVFPLVLIIVLFLFFTLFENTRYQKFKILFAVVGTSLIVMNTPYLIKQINKARKIDTIYYGLTPDWEHYLKLSNWASENIPADELIACRKPANSFIYGNGRKFYGIENVPKFSGNSIMSDWYQHETNYYAVYFTELKTKSIDTSLRNILLRDMIMLLVNDRKTVCLFKNTEPTINIVYNYCKESNLQYFKSRETLFNSFYAPVNETFYYFPDSFLRELYKNKVRYIIIAKLRYNHDAKSNITINTVERYINTIGVKYPKLFTPVYHFGEANDEPAWLLKLNYERYGMKY